MRGLTRVEAKFLNDLKDLVKDTSEGERLFESVYLTPSRESEKNLFLAFRLSGSSALLFVEVLIYGNRPVRYSLSTETGESARHSRVFWNRLLGPLNLVDDKSGEWDGRMHLFYEVFLSDAQLKELGE